MKKLILILLVLLVCTFQTATAYEYFTIYFSNGTKSEAFYATDVDSICYSKLSLDSIAYDDWQVQEIYTCDSVYRYPLAQIDSLSFKDVDVNKVAEDINKASSVIVPLYAQCESIEELSEHLSTIQNSEGVKDAWIDGQSLFIDIKDYGAISFIYPPQKTIGEVSLARAMQMTSSESVLPIAKNYQNDIGKVCIINHMAKDEDSGFDDARWVVKELKEMYDNMGFLCDVPDVFQPDFFESKMFEYDQLFIITHGFYEKKSKTHWLATDKELLCITNPSIFSFSAQLWKDFLNHMHYSTNKLRIISHSEIRNGTNCVVFYIAVSEHFISSSKNHFQNTNAIVFNAACESLKGNLSQQGIKTIDYSMGNTFVNKGASCYFGYDDSNRIGRYGGFEFFQALLNGSCVKGSYNSITDNLKEEQFDGYHPKLRKIIKNPNLRVLQTETLKSENEQTNNRVKLRGRIKKIDSDIIHVEKLQLTIPGLKEIYKYGFQYSTNADMSQAKDIEVQGNYDSNTLYMNWEATLDDKDLNPNTTYYYRAYIYDGFSNCYGEIKQFTTEDNAEAYAVWDEVNKTATYYYDSMCKSRNGRKIYRVGPTDFSIEKVIFDSSFSDYYPNSISFRNCKSLQSIDNIQYLNTDSVTDMRQMFEYCSSLTRLDLSNFNTANVTKMWGMFQGCRSLTNLDLSSFNTANVTNMSIMFTNCSSLTSLDLSSFNTANVTDMRQMFEYCSSLTSLDLSSFNTANVTNMGSMFRRCSSLTNLDLSGFHTANVTDISYMFCGCSSLTSLDLSSFNMADVTDMSYMFKDCCALTNLDLSGFHTANVTDISYMFCGCSSLTSLDLSSFNTANVTKTNMWGMFYECRSLTSLDLSSFNTANVTDMSDMFYDCNSLTSLDLSSFNTANVTDMSEMFSGCSALTSLDLSSFNTANVTDMRQMFEYCSSLTNLDLSSFNTANVTNMGSMFWHCSSLTNLDLSSFNTANVTDMGSMFCGCSALTSLDLSSFNTANVTDMFCMFLDCNALIELDFRNLVLTGRVGGGLFENLKCLQHINLSNANTEKATYMGSMFQSCSSLTSLDLSGFNTANVTNMEEMFRGCRALTDLNLSSFNTANVTDMKYMFSSCSALTSLDLSNFNTANVTDMHNMFYDCNSLTSLDLSNFNTANVTDMSDMFYDCNSLTSLDLSSFNTDNVTNMFCMFYDCNSLTTIYAGNWKGYYGMFFGCNNLVGGQGTKIGNNLYGYDEDGNPRYYYLSEGVNAAHIDGGRDNPGLFTAK